MSIVKLRFKSAVSRFARRLCRDQSGQGMTEYILIVAIVAVLSISFVSFFGSNIRGLFQAAGNALAGEDVNMQNLRKNDKDTRQTIRDLDKTKSTD